MPLLVHMELVAFANAGLWPFQTPKRTQRGSIEFTIFLGGTSSQPYGLRAGFVITHADTYMQYHICIQCIYIY